MIALVLDEDLRKAARRCVWFEAPENAQADPARLAAYILTFGSAEDVHALRRQLTDAQLAALIDGAPPGIFDARSWAYWNLMVGRSATPPMPRRTF
jgi:hypothetical protein